MSKQRERPGAGGTGAKNVFRLADRRSLQKNKGEVNHLPPWPTLDADGHPVVLCQRVGTNGLRFWCPFCRGIHTHGAAGGEGHRAAHCYSEAGRRAFAHGYVLRVVGRGGA